MLIVINTIEIIDATVAHNVRVMLYEAKESHELTTRMMWLVTCQNFFF